MVKLIASLVCLAAAACSSPDTRAPDQAQPPIADPAPDQGAADEPEPPSIDPCSPQERDLDMGDAGRLRFYVVTACGGRDPLAIINAPKGDPMPGEER